ncbi:hypothetical protein GRI58_06055 [Porphyrobacter algicida]|uniref:Uncharacterized protein n=1 Tax=Qipengyuania algicida TaxID=1836209 RepID=A0A845AFI4_9SPHN|nr:hypothetical protein [Qipengyuania algicida]MXP28384.1 hypothetical protein [Qipengyuania algicida]
MGRIADLLKAAADDDDFPVKEFENGDMTYIIKEVDKDDGDDTVTILLESADKNAPNTRYVNHAAKTKRDFNKQKDEGGGHSAHIVISLTPEATGDNVYLGLVEKVPNFPEHRVRSVLNTAIRLLCQEDNHFLYKMPGGSKREIPFVPHLDFHGHASYALQTDLEKGAINSITLVEPDTAKPLGQGKYFSGVEKYMKVKMLRKPKSGQVLSTIRAAAKSQSKDYSQIRISFKPESGGRSTHVDLDADSGKLISEGYVKTKHFGGITPPITTSAVDHFVPHLVSRMKHELIKERS